MHLLKRLLAAFFLSQCSLGLPAFAAEPAGRVVFVMGQGQVERQGRLTGLTAGDAVFESDRVITGRAGHVHLKTRDGSLIAVRPESVVVLGAYRFNSASKDETAIRWELSKGVVRFVTGEALEQRKDRFRLNTPIAAIGVRGTDFSVFADGQTTRVSVVVGEVVLAPLVGSCQRDAVGVCSGENALGLSAAERQSMLILERGQVRPRVAPIDATAPDRVSPPLEGRAISTAPSTESKAAPETQATVAERVTQVIEANAKANPVSPPPGPDNTKPNEPVVVVEPIKVNWGRWRPIANAGAQVSMTEKREDGSYLFANDTHMVYRSPVDQPKLPMQGQVSFKLTDAEAWLINAGVASQAAVTGGNLLVDFARNTFLFDMSVNADSRVWDLRASGDLTMRGLLVSDWNLPGSNTTVRGALAGAEVTQAATLFNRTLGPSQQISGAARWSR